MAKSSVALIAGVTGILGNSLVKMLLKPDAAGGPWKVYGIARRPKPEWFDNEGVDYVQCDLTNREEALSKLSSLRGVTHVFWATWTKRGDEIEDCEANGSMLDNLLDAVLPAAPGLRHICLTTGVKHYLGPHARFGSTEHHRPPFREDLPRLLSHPNFYYVWEDKVMAVCSRRPGITWSVHRPNIIFGFAPRNAANVLGSLVVYATVCKYQGLKFAFPGNRMIWESETNVSNADLIAEQELWVAVQDASSAAKNQAFNVANRDVVTWQKIWKALAEELKLEVPEYDGEGFSLEEMMRSKQDIWRQIADENSLVERELYQGQFWAVDLCLNLPFQLLSSLEKGRELGFDSGVDTCDSLVRWIDEMRLKRVIPSGLFWM